MRSTPFAFALFAAASLRAPAAWADRIALLSTRGAADTAARAGLDGDLTQGLAALGHRMVPEPDVNAAVISHVADGATDTLDEYRSVGTATRADWVVVGSVDPAVRTARIEIVACLVTAGRVESVAREVDKAHSQRQVHEMLAVLLRPEGIGAGALPWENVSPRVAPPAPPPAAPPAAAPVPPPVPPVNGRARIHYPLGTRGEVWPPYSGGKRGFASAKLGFSLPLVRPSPLGATLPSGGAWVGAVRGGYAVTDLGLEALAELGGNLAGPSALWLAAGARWMGAPAVKRGTDGILEGVPFFLGPEILAGAFFRVGATRGSYSASGATSPILGVGLDLAYAFSPSFQLEASVGDVRWIPSADGSLLVVGATLGAAFRFR